MELEKVDCKVFVRCFTYNQSIYIKNTMDGFTMQETNFPYVCCIVDDASNDGEQNVIKAYVSEHFDNDSKKEISTDYAQIIIAQNLNNRNCYFIILLLKENHYHNKALWGRKMKYISEWRDRCNYEACCEGDDFWVDKQKLQIQFDFLEKHPDYTMVFTAINLLFPDGRQKQEYRYSHDNDNCDVRDCILAGGGYSKLASMMYVRGKEEYSSWLKNSLVGDGPMTLSLFTRGKVMYMDRVTATYRVNAAGSWTLSTYSSFRKKLQHNKVASKMWKSFDGFSGYKYHKIIKRKLLSNYINLYPSPIRLIGYCFIKLFYPIR